MRRRRLFFVSARILHFYRFVTIFYGKNDNLKQGGRKTSLIFAVEGIENIICCLADRCVGKNRVARRFFAGAGTSK